MGVPTELYLDLLLENKQGLMDSTNRNEIVCKLAFHNLCMVLQMVQIVALFLAR